MREDPGNEFNIFSKEAENSWSAVVVWPEISKFLEISGLFSFDESGKVIFPDSHHDSAECI